MMHRPLLRLAAALLLPALIVACAPADRSGALSPEARAVAAEAPPHGTLRRACELQQGALGQQVEAHGRYRIYDSAPGGSGQRSFFLTGFDDGCPRQFRAALAMFGSAEMHEQLRYGLPKEVQPYSETDRAYEEIKARVCRVPRQQPCGGRITRLAKDTVFVSVYERFGSNPRWTNLLLHDGEVAAMDEKRG